LKLNSISSYTTIKSDIFIEGVHMKSLKLVTPVMGDLILGWIWKLFWEKSNILQLIDIK